MTIKPTLTAERLREVLDYDPETGTFYHLRGGHGTKLGSVAGCLNHLGYIQIGVDDRRYLAHRLAWLYVHGAWPDGFLDHIDRDRSNNRISNLRKATNAENQQNVDRPTTRSVTGIRGVRFQAGAWEAAIQVRGRGIYLGRFSTPEAAAAAYAAARRQHHPFAPIHQTDLTMS